MTRRENSSADPVNQQSLVHLEEPKLKSILERIVKELNPVKIILFGSRAEGKATKDSDIDLLVILERMPDRKTKFELSLQLSKENSVYVQLIPILVQTYEETKHIIGGIAYPATKYGVEIYEKS